MVSLLQRGVENEQGGPPPLSGENEAVGSAASDAAEWRELRHEVRNALAAAAGYAQFLQRQASTGLDRAERQALQAILANVSRATRLLELAPRRPAACDLRRLVAQAADYLPPERRDDLAIVADGTEPLIGEWDGSRLAEVLANLLDNAAKYSAPGARIAIELRRTADLAQILVRDQGIGIEAAALEQIFAGYRTPHARRMAGGHGIGLRLSRRLVAAEGGRLWATSQPGAGSVFIVELPLTATRSQQEGG